MWARWKRGRSNILIFWTWAVQSSCATQKRTARLESYQATPRFSRVQSSIWKIAGACLPFISAFSCSLAFGDPPLRIKVMKLRGFHSNHQCHLVQSRRSSACAVEVFWYVRSPWEDLVVLRICLFMFNFSCHVPEMDGCCEAQSTTFNSFINQASVRGMNYWLSEFRGNSLFLFSPWWTCFAVVRRVPGRSGIMECLFFRHTKGYKMTAERRAVGEYAQAIIQYVNQIFFSFSVVKQNNRARLRCKIARLY